MKVITPNYSSPFEVGFSFKYLNNVPIYRSHIVLHSGGKWGVRCCSELPRECAGVLITSGFHLLHTLRKKLFEKAEILCFAATVDLWQAYKFWTSYLGFLTSFKANELRKIGKSFHASLYYSMRTCTSAIFVCIDNSVPVVYSVTHFTKTLRTFKLPYGFTVRV